MSPLDKLLKDNNLPLNNWDAALGASNSPGDRQSTLIREAYQLGVTSRDHEVENLRLKLRTAMERIAIITQAQPNITLEVKQKGWLQQLLGF